MLKLDIKKYYENVDHQILKELLGRKFKDSSLLWLLDDIIYSVPKGLPLGNYCSQIFANFYLSSFDHWIKQEKRIKHYFRYMDDMVILSDNKKDLWDLLYQIRKYLSSNLKLEIKRNYQIFPLSARGVDFVGYVHYKTHTLLRKTIKNKIKKMLRNRPNKGSIASYNGWLVHCNSKNLIKTLNIKEYDKSKEV